MTFNLSPKKTPMNVRDAVERRNTFEEVALGYSEEDAILEAKRCLHCKNAPCVAGCPVGIDIPAFVSLVASGEFEAAYQVIAKSSSLPAVCGRVCPQESQCEGKCTRALKAGCESVAIGRLERFVADYHARHDTKEIEKIPENGQKVAVVGSGPAGLSCAGELKKAGYGVTIFEALHTAGGVLTYGIPEFRLPKAIVKREVDALQKAGVNIQTDVVVGRTVTVDELLEEYDAVFIGSGAGLPRFMNIPGENLKGVYSANEFLTRVNLMGAYKEGAKTPVYRAKRVAVVGGGNVAMDAARCAKRLGAEVYIVYRRGEEELPARREEIEHAKEEGVVFELLCNPVRILATKETDSRAPSYGFVDGVECVRMELGEADESGRKSPKEIKGSEFVLPVDCVIMALGTSPNPLISATTEGLFVKPRGEIQTDENGKTSMEGVYCGGDASTGAATVIKAMGAGKRAAQAIDEYLQRKKR